MNERLRAPLAAALALLIGGDLAARGPGALFDVWRFLFPYLWMFLAFEALRRHRRLLDDEAFLLGAAVGLLNGGILAKDLQDGLFFLGVNWLGAAMAAFDWGMIAVIALHCADAWRPRPDRYGDPGPGGATTELIALVFLPAGALAGYLVDCFTGRLRYERMLGPAWMIADILFAAAAYWLYRRLLARADEEDPAPRDRGLWLLCAVAAWLPGAQLSARLGGEWPSAVSIMFLLFWTAGFGFWFAGLWRRRGLFDVEPRRAATPALSVAAWRLAGAVLLVLVLGSTLVDGRSAAAFTFLVDLPVRLLFVSIFFRYRLAV